MAEQQSFAHHSKWVGGFHGFVLPALLLNAGWSIYQWIHLGWTIGGLIAVLTAIALLLLVVLRPGFCVDSAGSGNSAGRTVAIGEAAASRSNTTHWRLHERTIGWIAVC